MRVRLFTRVLSRLIFLFSPPSKLCRIPLGPCATRKHGHHYALREPYSIIELLRCNTILDRVPCWTQTAILSSAYRITVFFFYNERNVIVSPP